MLGDQFLQRAIELVGALDRVLDEFRAEDDFESRDRSNVCLSMMSAPYEEVDEELAIIHVQCREPMNAGSRNRNGRPIMLGGSA
jgi:hypothetical protein